MLGIDTNAKDRSKEIRSPARLITSKQRYRFFLRDLHELGVRLYNTLALKNRQYNVCVVRLAIKVE